MNTLLFLMLGAGLFVVSAVRQSAKVKNALSKHQNNFRIVPKAITMLVLAAQVSELLKAIEHVSIVNVVAALFMLVIVATTTSGTESETP